MKLSFETRRKLILAGKIALVVLAIALVVWACWLVWVDRYVVYTREGARIDYALTEESYGAGTLALPPEEKITASVYFDDGTNTQDYATTLARLEGYYIDYNMLATDIDTVRAAVSVLPVGSAVMMEVKSIKGSFYYSTNISGAKTASSIDAQAVDLLIEDMTSRNLYLIATLPAFRDRAYGLEHTNNGLPYIGGGGALWLDEQNCYWLNPGKSGTINYLTQITEELEILGFDEVMFTDFRFPETDQLDYSGDKAAAIKTAAENLVSKCAGDTFAVSFLASDSTVQAVDGRSRLYLKGVDAADAAAAAAQYSMEDPAVGIVFLTESHDTRYEAFGALRPITSFVDHE